MADNRFHLDDAAIKRLADEMTDNWRAHLNEVSNEVFAAHAGQPVDEVLAVFLRAAETPSYKPNAEGLRPAAQAISEGKRFTFV